MTESKKTSPTFHKSKDGRANITVVPSKYYRSGWDGTLPSKSSFLIEIATQEEWQAFILKTNIKPQKIKRWSDDFLPFPRWTPSVWKPEKKKCLVRYVISLQVAFGWKKTPCKNTSFSASFEWHGGKVTPLSQTTITKTTWISIYLLSHTVAWSCWKKWIGER